MKKQKRIKKFSFPYYLLKHKYKLIGYIFSTSIYFLLNIVSVLFVATALTFITEANYDLTLLYIGYSTLVLLTGKISETICEILFAILVRDISTEMRNDLTQRVFEISSKSFNENSTGMFISRIANSPDNAINNISDLIYCIGHIVSYTVTVIYIIVLNIYVGLIILGIIILISILEYFKIKIYTKNKKKEKKSHDNVVSFSNEIIRSEKDIKALSLEKKLKLNSSDIYDNYKKQRFKAYTTDIAFWIVKQVLIIIFIFLLIMFCVYLVKNVHLSVSAFLFIFINRESFTHFFWNLGHSFKLIANIKVESKRFLQIFDGKIFPVEKFGQTILENCKGEIEFKNVTFGYADILKDEDKFEDFDKTRKIIKKSSKQELEQTVTNDKKTVLHNISFKIQSGQTVAFVGRSGSGKSTILSLIPKLYECDSGEILIDGINVNDLTKESLRNNISLVNQFPYIFNASIKENLLMSNKDVTDKELFDSLKKASLFEFVSELPNKINTVVGENGIKLSGGQKQRLAISRALIKNSKIILFDESTSSLDNFAQEEVKKSIQALQGGKTVVIVAHRLSTIKNAEKIFFIDNGKLIAEGTFDELFNNLETFKEMFFAENI